MSAKFDPYYTWLAIPPEEQPPHHYRLLGVKALEENLDVIENAADQRMKHLRDYQSGKHGELSQKLLNEVSAARVVLLDAEKKSAYDAELRAKLDAAKQAELRKAREERPLAMAKPLPTAAPLDAKPAAPAPARMAAPQFSTTARPRASNNAALLIAAGVVVLVLLAGGGIAAMMFLAGDEPVAAVTPPTNGTVNNTPGENPEATANVAPVVPPVIPPIDNNGTPAVEPRAVVDNDPRSETPTDDPPATNDPAEPIDDEPTDGGDGEEFVAVEDEPAAPAKLPVPEKVAREAKGKEILAIFPVANARTFEEKGEYAAQLIRTAGETVDDPAAVFAMLNLAREQAAEAGQIKLAFEATDLLAETFDFDGQAVRLASVQQASRATLPAAAKREIVIAGMDVIDELTSADKFDDADALFDRMLAIARPLRDPELIKSVADQRKAFTELAVSYKKAQIAFETLKTSPDDADANLAAGRYLAFVKQDWEAGLTHLAKGSDAALAAAAQGEIASPESLADLEKLADAWWTAAEAQKDVIAQDDCRAQAESLYSEVVGELVGLPKVRVEKRIAELATLRQQPTKLPARRSSRRPISPVTDDLWDIGQGIEVTSHSPLDEGAHYDVRGIFGLNYDAGSGESDGVVFGQADPGTVHFVEWKTPQPVTIRRLRLAAVTDDAIHKTRGISSWTIFAWNAKQDKFIKIFELHPAFPYADTTAPTRGAVETKVARNELRLEATIPAVTAQRFRAEFVQALDTRFPRYGVRVREMDAFSDARTSRLKSATSEPDAGIVSRDPVELEPPQEDDFVYLDDLTETASEVGYGSLGKHGADGARGKVIFAGELCTHSLSVHAKESDAAYVTYRLGKKYDTFQATAGLRESSGGERGESVSPLTFSVIGDKKVLWKSRPIKQHGDGESCSVSVRGVDVLTLQVDSPGPAGQGWSIWVDPRLTHAKSSTWSKPPRRTDLQPRQVVAVASGSNHHTVFVNGQKLLDCGRDKATSAPCILKPGDVITVRMGDRFDIKSFWLMALSDKGEYLFETSEDWIGYMPVDDARWWDVSTKDLRQEPAQFTGDGREYVNHVQAAAATAAPKYKKTDKAKPIFSPIQGKDGYAATFLAYVVTVDDLKPKKVEGDDSASVSDVRPPKGKKPNAKAFYNCVIGGYTNFHDGKPVYPLLNLQVPQNNLWNDKYAAQLQNMVRDSLAYKGQARFFAPQDGDYDVQAANMGVTIDGVKLAGFRDAYTERVTLRKGLHTIVLDSHTHGQPYLQNASVKIIDAKTGDELPLVNLWADVQAALATPVGGQRVIEISGWQPEEEKIVPIKLK